MPQWALSRMLSAMSVLQYGASTGNQALHKEREHNVPGHFARSQRRQGGHSQSHLRTSVNHGAGPEGKHEESGGGTQQRPEHLQSQAGEKTRSGK